MDTNQLLEKLSQTCKQQNALSLEYMSYQDKILHERLGALLTENIYNLEEENHCSQQRELLPSHHIPLLF